MGFQIGDKVWARSHDGLWHRAIIRSFQGPTGCRAWCEECEGEFGVHYENLRTRDQGPPPSESPLE
jgi:hypothetical protein